MGRLILDTCDRGMRSRHPFGSYRRLRRPRIPSPTSVPPRWLAGARERVIERMGHSTTREPASGSRGLFLLESL